MSNREDLDFEEVMFQKKELDPKEGYTFKIENMPIKNGIESFRIKCLDKEGKIVGSSHIYKYKDHIKSAEVLVNRYHRRKGIASAMYKEAAKYSGVPILPSGVMTQDGKALWGSFNKSEEDLNKGLKGAVAGVAMMGAAMAPTAAGNLHDDNPDYTAPRNEQRFPGMYDQKPEELHPHLKAISFLETSGGKNVDHAKHSKGPWHTAFGELGFKPVSAYEEYRRQPDLKRRFPGLEDKVRFMEVFTKQPSVYNAIANHYWKRLLSEFKDPEKVAYAWRLGEYGARKLKPHQYKNHEYVRRFGDMFAPVHPEIAMHKAIADIDPGEEDDGRTDYSHVLPQSLYRKGYRIIVDDGQDPTGRTIVEANIKLREDGMNVHVGHADGAIGTTKWDEPGYQQTGAKILRIGTTEVEEDFRRHGLGLAMYEAMMAHAKHKFKCTHVAGGVHSTSAHATHEKLAQKHGLKYKADKGPGDPDEAEDRGVFDDAFGPYKYTLR